MIHTANPITKERGEIFGEVVLGMGEALVGNYPGRALSFSAKPDSQVRLAAVRLHVVHLADEPLRAVSLTDKAS